MFEKLDFPLLDQLGVLGIPLLVCGCIILAIVLERLIFYLLAHPLSKQLMDQLVKDKRGELTLEAGNEIAANRFGSIFLELYENRTLPSKEREDLCAVRLMDAERTLTSYLPLLKILAAISPLLGLLGTVLGMIDSFQLISTVNRPITPSLVSGGIAQALLTTAVGLILAIAALIPYTLFQQRAASIMQQLTRQLNLINLTLEKQARQRRQSSVAVYRKGRK